MGKKRSVGVTLLGCFFIIGSVLVMVGAINYKFYFLMHGTGIVAYAQYIYSVINFIASLICGIYVLRLASWARKLAIILALFSICVLPFTLRGVKKSFAKVETIENQFYKDMEQKVIRDSPTERQGKELEGLVRLRQMGQRQRELSPTIFALFTIGINFLIIFFFTRPKVKEQFAESTFA